MFFLEASQADEHHEGTSGKYSGVKGYHLKGGGKFNDRIDISGFLLIRLSTPEICRSIEPVCEDNSPT